MSTDFSTASNGILKFHPKPWATALSIRTAVLKVDKTFQMKFLISEQIIGRNIIVAHEIPSMDSFDNFVHALNAERW